MPESYRIESDPDWDAEAEEEAADREPIARVGGRNLKWWIIAAVFTLAMALFATGKIMGAAAEQVTAETFGFKVVDDRTATITFDVTKPPETTVRCTVHAQDLKKALVGSAEIVVPPAAQRTTTHTATIKTTTRAVAAIVQSCVRQ